MTTAKKIPQNDLHRLQAVRTALQKPIEVKLLGERMRELDREFARQTKQLTALTKDFAKKLTKKN